MKRSHLVRDIVEIVALTIVIFIALSIAIKSYRVDDDSMSPGLSVRSYIMVNKVAYWFRPPARGDVVVLDYPYDTTKVYVKRIIGLPGDKVRVDGDHVWVNGVQLDEHTYVSQALNPAAREWVVEQDHFFVLGDNRLNGQDSRSPQWGTIDKKFIIGKATLIFWPRNQWKTIPNYPNVFNQIK